MAAPLERRSIVERFVSWIPRERRLPVGGEYYAFKFLGFAWPAALCVLLKQF